MSRKLKEGDRVGVVCHEGGGVEIEAIIRDWELTVGVISDLGGADSKLIKAVCERVVHDEITINTNNCDICTGLIEVAENFEGDLRVFALNTVKSDEPRQYRL